MLIPIFGIALCVALWGQWFPLEGATDPEQPILRRLGSTLRHTLQAWVLVEMVSAEAPRDDALNEESFSHPGMRADVDLTEDPGLNWFYGIDDGVPFSPIVWETSPVSPTPVRSAPAVCEWNGSVDFLETGSADSSSSRTPRGGVLVSCLICGMFFITWLVFTGRMVLFAYTRQFFEYLEALLQRMLNFFGRPPQIARVQFAHAQPTDDEVLFGPYKSQTEILIESLRRNDAELEAWSKELEESCLDSVLSVSVVSQSEGTCIQQVAGSLPDELPLEDTTELNCNATEMDAPTEDVRMETVSEASGIPPTKKKNRPSAKTRRRKYRQAQRALAENLANTLSESPVEASSQ